MSRNINGPQGTRHALIVCVPLVAARLRVGRARSCQVLVGTRPERFGPIHPSPGHNLYFLPRVHRLQQVETQERPKNQFTVGRLCLRRKNHSKTASMLGAGEPFARTTKPRPKSTHQNLRRATSTFLPACSPRRPTPLNPCAADTHTPGQVPARFRPVTVPPRDPRL